MPEMSGPLQAFAKDIYLGQHVQGYSTAYPDPGQLVDIDERTAAAAAGDSNVSLMAILDALASTDPAHS